MRPHMRRLKIDVHWVATETPCAGPLPSAGFPMPGEMSCVLPPVPLHLGGDVTFYIYVYYYFFFLFIFYLLDGTIEDCTFPSLRLPCTAHWDPASLCGEPIPGQLFTSLLRLLKHSYHRRWRETAQVLIGCCLKRPNNCYRRLVEGLEMCGVTGADCHPWPLILMCLHVSL